MDFSQAFKMTLFRFDLNGSDIAERSGLTSAQISNFRNGKNLRIDSVERILKTLPEEARAYMLHLVGQDDQEGSESQLDYGSDKSDASDG